MVTKTQSRKMFDIQETANKLRQKLAKLEIEQKPGELAGRGTKTDVLLAMRAEIKTLMEKGYTARQIAEAIREDVGGILPKTITELARTGKPEAKRRGKMDGVEEAKQSVSPAASAPRPAPKKVERKPAPVSVASKVLADTTFQITPDSDDL